MTSQIPTPERICVLAQETDLRKTLEKLAHQKGYQVHTCADARGAAQLISSGRLDALILELPLTPGGDPPDVQHLRDLGEDTVLIGISADPQPDLALAALQAGLDDYLRKPFTAEELFQRMATALKRQQKQRSLQAGNRRQRITIDTLNATLEKRTENLKGAMQTLKEERLSRRTTQIALRRSEAKFNELLDTSPDLIYVLDRHGRFSYLSPSVGALLGISGNELIGHHFSALLPPELLPHAQYHFRERRTRQRATRSYEISLIRKHHNTPEALPRFQLYASGIYTPATAGGQAHSHYIGTCGIAREVSRMQDLEHRLLRTEEAACIGQIALCAARRLSSPLQGVLSLLSAVEKQNVEANLPDKELGLLHEGVAQIRRIAQQLTSLQQPTVRRRERLDLTLFVAETVELLRPDLQLKKIFCQYSLAPDPLPIFADRTQLRQLIAILINNAMDAITHQYGPTPGENKHQLLVVTAQQGDGALMRIFDSGPGLRQGDLPYLFEPFFSRKPQMGAGLGLYLAKGIVTGHGGRISAGNNARGQAVFSVYLPLVTPHIEAA
jgi:PAS domain S-box-containing protein